MTRHISGKTQTIMLLGSPISHSKSPAMQNGVFDLGDKGALRSEISSSDIFINGTPIGMNETICKSVIPDRSFFHPSLVVSDLVYVPAETALLKMAKAAGCKNRERLRHAAISRRKRIQDVDTGHKMPVAVARQILFKQF